MIFMMLALCILAYWILIKILYGSLSFDLVFLIGGITLLLTALFLHQRQSTFKELLPLWGYRSLLIFILLACSIFGIVESRILYDAHRIEEGHGDVILVLGAGLVNGNQVSRSLAYRLEEAYQEHKKNPHTPIIVSGGQGFDETISEAQAMKQWLINHEVPETLIWMEDQSTTTSENFTLSMELMRAHGMDSNKVTLITNAFHMHRAKYLGKSYGLSLYGRPAKELTWAKPCFYTREFFAMMRAYLLQR